MVTSKDGKMNLSRKIFFLIVILSVSHRILYAQDTATYIKKVFLSGSLNGCINKVEYWDIQEQRLATGIKTYLTLNASFDVGRSYALTVGFYYYINKQAYNITWLPDYSIIFRRDKYSPNTFFLGI